LHGRKVAPSLASGAAPRVDPRILADAVSELSRVYTRERGQMARLDKRSLLARAGFFFPRDLPKIFGPLDELVAAGLAPDKAELRVLDVGAGLGATSFGLARWLRLRGRPVQSLRVVALEHNAPVLHGFQSFVRALSELPDEFVPIALEASLLLLLEPALKETTRELMQVRDVLAARAAAPFVIAPCLHALACPMLPSERDWCHQELAYALPPSLADVARAASLRYEGLSYASLVLANSPRPTLPAHSYRVVSDRLASKGKLELYGCSEAGYTRLTRLDRHASEHNHPFESARRGHVLTVATSSPRISADTKVERADEPPRT